ncbi:hypothetical protein [Pinirhizobacter soli]|uniref:hypothetical protein n=1 Tax=Pinirhizobacter soli TaxID=2786953 RepID=UPI00202AAC3B|nr:hypothetical protein [Pinirhizobacter soli]
MKKSALRAILIGAGYLATVSVATFLAPAAHASTTVSTRTFTTFGLRRCKSWLEHVPGKAATPDQFANSLARTADVSWLAGYATGVNASASGSVDLLKDLDVDTLSDWMDAYCAQHPKDDAVDGISALFSKLGLKP